MRILSWVQTRINRQQDKKKRSEEAPARHHVVQDTCKEEFIDWPQGLLAIGTFGNDEFRKHPHNHEDFQNSQPPQDLPEFTVEEGATLENELIKLLSLKTKCKAPSSETATGCHSNLPLDKFVDCPSILEDEQSVYSKFCDELQREDGGDLSPNTKIILNKAKDADKRNNGIGRKSISCLLKMMLLYRSDFAPAPSLRDPIPQSRMEKFLKKILHKKIHPQNSAPTTVKKYLEKKQMDKTEIRDKILMTMEDKSEEKRGGSKWVKTDSECNLWAVMCSGCYERKKTVGWDQELVEKLTSSRRRNPYVMMVSLNLIRLQSLPRRKSCSKVHACHANADEGS